MGQKTAEYQSRDRRKKTKSGGDETEKIAAELASRQKEQQEKNRSQNRRHQPRSSGGETCGKNRRPTGWIVGQPPVGIDVGEGDRRNSWKSVTGPQSDPSSNQSACKQVDHRVRHVRQAFEHVDRDPAREPGSGNDQCRYKRRGVPTQRGGRQRDGVGGFPDDGKDPDQKRGDGRGPQNCGRDRAHVGCMGVGIEGGHRRDPSAGRRG